MRCVSSASFTCSAPRSASEYTATVRIPMRFAVRITRQAIWPRFAIRILRNTLALPGRLALLEEGGDAFLAFGRGADLGDAACRIGLERAVDRPARHLADQVFDARMRFAAGGKQMLDEPINGGVQLRRRHERREQADAQRLGGIEYFSSEEITARGARADGAHDVRADRGRREAELRLGVAGLRLRRA